MKSRDSILKAIKNIEMEAIALPEMPAFNVWFKDTTIQFKEILKFIGANVRQVATMAEVGALIQQQYGDMKRVLTNESAFYSFASSIDRNALPRSYENVDLSIMKASLGVAENGAIWITEDEIVCRVLPFICQHLVLIVPESGIVPLMADAYCKIADSAYAYGTFIAGPSKTADIEQSLVLGAHGARSLTVFIVES